MIGAFVWEQPVWLGGLLAVACALGANWRMARLAPPAVGEGDQPGAGWRERHGWPRVALRLLVVAGAGGGAVLLSAWLAYTATPVALGLLGLLAAIALVWLTLASYRRQWGGLSPLSGTVLVMLRLLAGGLLLLLLGRPVLDWVVVEWRKPLLVVLLDQSESMAVVDREEGAQARRRADLANAAMRSARAAITRLGEAYEVRVRGAGATLTPLDDWRIEPRAPISALTGGVRDAGQMRSKEGTQPAAVLLVSDGAENVESAPAFRAAVAALAEEGIGLLAVGVGPAPGEVPLVELGPLALPAQLGLRDRLRVPVSARVQGCAGAVIGVELLWDADPVAREKIRVDYDIQHVGTEFDTVPPGPGVHRLTVRVTLPADLGGQSFQSFAVVDVRDERIRVLIVEDTPRTETGFLTRALQGDPRLEVTQRFLFGRSNRDGLAAEWADYDVIVLGRLRTALPDPVLAALTRAVTENGAGLLLAGGRALLNDVDLAQTPLTGISATGFVVDQFGVEGPLAFLPTEVGLRDPILRGVSGGAGATTQPDERAIWLSLPPMGGAALLGGPKPLARVLAVDGVGRPILAAHAVGRGRCATAAWESTWAWALASDDGAKLHRRLWRHLALWLANRRPRAWVMTDRPSYSLAALASGQQRVRIRAGVSGHDADGVSGDTEAAIGRLELVAGGVRREVRLEQRGDEWLAELPMPDAGVDTLPPGQCVLEFTLEGADGEIGESAGPSFEPLTARTGFAIEQTRIEHQVPTANLGLLRSAADKTAGQGGGYYELEQLPALLRELGQNDRREEVRRRVRYSVIDREPWELLVALVVVLSLEWTIRKRLGLA